MRLLGETAADVIRKQNVSVCLEMAGRWQERREMSNWTSIAVLYCTHILLPDASHPICLPSSKKASVLTITHYTRRTPDTHPASDSTATDCSIYCTHR